CTSTEPSPSHTYTLSLHDALPISGTVDHLVDRGVVVGERPGVADERVERLPGDPDLDPAAGPDRLFDRADRDRDPGGDQDEVPSCLRRQVGGRGEHRYVGEDVPQRRRLRADEIEVAVVDDVHHVDPVGGQVVGDVGNELD